MIRKKRHHRISLIAYIDDTISVCFKYNEEEQCIGSVEDKKAKYEKLRSVNGKQKNIKNLNHDDSCNQNNYLNVLLKFQKSLHNKSPIPKINLAINKSDSPVPNSYDDHVSSKLAIADNHNDNEFNNNETELKRKVIETNIFNLEDSFSLLKSCSYYLNDDDYFDLNEMNEFVDQYNNNI